jgi:hypothetical protein
VDNPVSSPFSRRGCFLPVTVRVETLMPRYFLNLTRGNDDLPNDHEPQEFSNLEAARIEAIESLREISATAAGENRRADYDGINVVSEDGRIFLRVRMSEALKH